MDDNHPSVRDKLCDIASIGIDKKVIEFKEE
jgi:hypothetical protein